MSEVRENLRYTEEHEWAEAHESGVVRVGITDFAQCELGDIVFVELPDFGMDIKAGDAIGTIESVKTVSDLFSPVSGKVSKINEVLLDQPELINNDPYSGGWLVEIELADAEAELGKLLNAEQYRKKIGE